MKKPLPEIIQGGMGVSVSGWRLARAAAAHGALGVVSGTAIEVVVARQLQLGDPGGHLRRAFAAFPFPGMPQRFLDRYFIPGGKRALAPFRGVPMHGIPGSRELEMMTVVASFAVVFLAKDGHSEPIGFTLLCKIPLPTLPALFGAMLAGVDVVLMGAGIPRTIPGILDDLAAGRKTALRLDVEGAKPDEQFFATFDPGDFCPGAMPALERPQFLAIVSSTVLAMTLTKKANGRVDGFVVEFPEAGGHNAPPRGGMRLDAAGEPIYGPRDRPDPACFAKLGVPFWLAGGFGMPGKLAEAKSLGAAGIQVGTPFAFCEESGIEPDLKSEILGMCHRHEVQVTTDPMASPTGFPFKRVVLPGDDPENRARVCDLGYLRALYSRDDGEIGFRCPGEPLGEFIRKGGCTDHVPGRLCICNGLIATAGLGQVRPDGITEPPIITSGDQLHAISIFCHGRSTYTAADVIDLLRS